VRYNACALQPLQLIVALRTVLAPHGMCTSPSWTQVCAACLCAAAVAVDCCVVYSACGMLYAPHGMCTSPLWTQVSAGCLCAAAVSTLLLHSHSACSILFASTASACVLFIWTPCISVLLNPRIPHTMLLLP
jgi:hypothetical protein